DGGRGGGGDGSVRRRVRSRAAATVAAIAGRRAGGDAGRNPADVRGGRARARAGSAEAQRRALSAVPRQIQGAAGRPAPDVAGTDSSAAGIESPHESRRRQRRRDAAQRTAESASGSRHAIGERASQGLRRDRLGPRRATAGKVSAVRGDDGASEARPPYASSAGEQSDETHQVAANR